MQRQATEIIEEIKRLREEERRVCTTDFENGVGVFSAQQSAECERVRARIEKLKRELNAG